MTSMPTNPPRRRVVVGVDTHQHIHVAVALDPVGARLAEGFFAADRAGYRGPPGWVTSSPSPSKAPAPTAPA